MTATYTLYIFSSIDVGKHRGLPHLSDRPSGDSYSVTHENV
jgi:hypothetical protein